MIGAAVKVMKIATGEIEEDIDDDGKNKAAVELGRKGGKANLRPFRRSACYDAVDGSHRRHRMSPLGYKRKSGRRRRMSAYTPTSDIRVAPFVACALLHRHPRRPFLG